MRRSQRVPRPAVPERGALRESGAASALSVRLSGRLLRRELRADPGGPDAQVEHGRTGRHSRLSADHSK